MRTFLLGASVLTAAAVSFIGARPARACGGCFAPPAPKQTTVVTGHRMAFSISPQQTVLWDQIEYSGSPQDFAWVLPVHGGAKVELSHDEFFAALDALTNPTITGPQPNCGGGGGGGFACGGSSSASPAGFAGEGNGNNVQVLSQGVVGPYDTVTVRSTNPTALYDWLVANGYDIPSATRPVIDAYVAGGFDFLALRLAPGQGVQAMKPVRVVTPGASLSLPLRMVAAGVGANVGITLYVVGEGRYEAAPKFTNALIDDTQLVWISSQSQSNYQTLAAQIMQRNGGHTWLTEYSQPVTLQGDPNAIGPSTGGSYSCASPGSNGVSYYGGNLSLSNLYFAQCVCAGPHLCGQTLVAPAGPTDDASLDALLEGATDEAQAPDSSSSGDDAAADAPLESAVQDAASTDAQGDDGSLIAPEAGCSAATPCVGFDDLEVASVGLDPNNIWVTRMRAQVPGNVLTEGDLPLQASASQSPISNQHFANVYDDPAYNPCPKGGGGCAAADQPLVIPQRYLIAGAFAFLGAALVRRRRQLLRR
jgi:hypothetical protein